MFEVCACLGDRSGQIANFGGLLGLLYHGCDDVGDVKGWPPSAAAAKRTCVTASLRCQQRWRSATRSGQNILRSEHGDLARTGQIFCRDAAGSGELPDKIAEEGEQRRFRSPSTRAVDRADRANPAVEPLLAGFSVVQSFTRGSR